MLTNLRYVAAVLLLGFTATASAQTGINNPMTRAVLEVYEQQLRENPSDYETWMSRANEYYNHSEYMRALNDVDNALKYIPENNKDDRRDAYILRANIYIQTGRSESALADLNSALALYPDNYVAIYQRANVEYELGRYDEAKNDYKRLQRLNSRSAESLIGLARIAVRENNLGLANEYLEHAVNLDPNNADYYVRRASVRRQMGNHRDAVDDLILALSTDSRNTRATQDLVDYGATNYAEVMAGLTSAMQSAPKVGMFVYLRAVIAQAHFRYNAALADFKRILDEQLYNYHGIYASMAQCQFALGHYEEALANVDHAISMDSNIPDHYILKSQILRALDRPAEAFDISLKASVINPGTSNALVEMGLCRADMDNWSEAADLFGEAQMNNSDSPEIYMLRAWALGEHLNQPVAARQFYEQAADIEGYADTNIHSLRGFALLLAGQRESGEEWLKNILATQPDNDGFLNFMAACFYCAAGDTDTAMEHAEKSMAAGFANYYDWTRNTDGRCTVAPLRDDLRFLNLLSRYSFLFND